MEKWVCILLLALISNLTFIQYSYTVIVLHIHNQITIDNGEEKKTTILS